MFSPITACIFLPLIYTQDIVDNVVFENTVYVPVGFHHKFVCEAQYILRQTPTRTPKWRISYLNTTAKKVTRRWITAGVEKAGNRFYHAGRSDSNLYGYFLQRIHNDVLLECVIDQIADTNSSHLISRYVSRTTVAIQDCSGNDDSQDKSNPCHFGKCQIRTVSNNMTLEYVECVCMNPYTGTFCNVPIPSSIYWTVLYYSPILFLLCVLGSIIICYPFFDVSRDARPLLLEKHMPTGNREIDLKKLFPASFVKTEDIPGLLNETLVDE